jgi:hypothetical protein
MYVLEVQDQTIFTKLVDVFPECSVLIKDSPKLHPLFCLKSNCPRNANCMGKLAHRVKYVFDQWPKAQLLILYFSYPDQPGSQRAGLFWRDMREPRYITMNRTAWVKLKKMGTIYKWQMPAELFLKATEPGVVQLSSPVTL